MSQKILIVEDEVHIRTLLEQALEELEDEHNVEVLWSRPSTWCKFCWP